MYINMVQGAPEWGSLPVGKIIDYPLEKRDYRPYAQVQLTLSPLSLHMRLLAFEVSPDPGSYLAAVFDFGGPFAYVDVYYASGQSAGLCGSGMSGIARGVRHIGGEDLQGVYWGVECSFSRPDIEASRGSVLAPGGVLRGNIYKGCEAPAPRPHFGSLFPSRPLLLGSDPRVALEELGAFELTGY